MLRDNNGAIALQLPFEPVGNENDSSVINKIKVEVVHSQPLVGVLYIQDQFSEKKQICILFGLLGVASGQTGSITIGNG